jgi:short-subunit dehydrogenase
MSITRFFISPPRQSTHSRISSALRGKTVLITGASFGIGEATARLLAKSGATLLLLARTQEKLETLGQEIMALGGKAYVYPVDLSQVNHLQEVMRRIQTEHPRIDVVISNAGKSIRRAISDSFDRDDLERLVALNFLGPSAMLRVLLPRMIEQGGGHVINVSSVSARLVGAPMWSAYQSSKTGFDVWFRSMGNELRPKNIFASSVYLPLVRTRMSAPSAVFDAVPALTAEEAAEVIAYAIVRKSDRVAPWWLWWAEWGSVWFEWPVNRILTMLYRRSTKTSSKISHQQGNDKGQS